MDTNKLSVLDKYQKRIFDYIRDYHPQIFIDKEELKRTVISRANSAQEAYTKAILRGENDVEARYEANQVLHAFLEFSPCAYIKEFYEELHHEEIDDEQAVLIWQKTEDIFENYGMDVEGSDAEDRLRDELLPFMQWAVRIATAFRLNSDLLERLKNKRKKKIEAWIIF